MPRKKKTVLVLILMITLPLAALLTLFLKETQNAFAIVQETESVTTDTDFATGTLTSTLVMGSGPTAKVQLVGTPGPDGMEYKMEVTVDNTGGVELTDYQVKISLDTQTLISGGKMQSDCDDIRINDSDEVTPIANYWVEKCNATDTEVWVKVPTISATTNHSLFLYYGNPGATNQANANNTFKIFGTEPESIVSHHGFNAIILEADGTVKNWGDATYGAGDGTQSTYDVPTAASGITNAKAVGAGLYSYYALLDDGTIRAWGRGTNGEMGNGANDADNFTPVTVQGITNAKKISVGGYLFACAVLDDGKVMCWGRNDQGQLGNNSISDSNIPVEVSGITNAVDIGTGDKHACAVLSDGTAKCWGDNFRFQLGDGSNTDSLIPVTVTGGITDFSKVSAGARRTQFLREDGTVMGVGENTDGLLGIGNSTSPITTPTLMPGISNANILNSQSYAIGCLVLTDGTLRCWGDGEYGALGINEALGIYTTPQNVLNISPVISVSESSKASITSTYSSTCAISKSGPAYCWGREDGGYQQLGNGPAVSTSNIVPVQISNYNFDGVLDKTGGMTATRKLNDTFFIREKTTVEPTTSNGSEELPLETSGTWESPSMDIEWNGGWGDGTGGSTTLSSTVANVGANATITYSIRAADSEANLTSASYEVIGIANSGTSFTADNTTVSALGLPTGSAGRYVQLKVDLASLDALTNPEMTDINLSYMEDNTVPEVQTTNLAMFQNNGGLAVPATTWTPNNEPRYTWADATDSQAGIAGYCLYLGTDSGGDPEISKGLLGTSPLTITDEPCPFIVETNTIDFSDTDLHGGTWLTSDTALYYLNVKAIDINNNVIGASVQHSFKYDDTLPTPTEFLSLPGDYISDKGATIYWPTGGVSGALDTHSGVAGLQYRISNSGTWYGDDHTGTEDLNDLLANDGSYTFTSTPDFANMAEGPNYIYLRAVDTAGNPSTTYAMGILKINTNAPSSPLNLVTTPTTNTINSFGFTWGPPITYTGQPDKISYCYTVNTLPSAQTCLYTAQGVTDLSADAYATQPGVNTMYVVAKDEAGNTNYGTYISTQFTADTSAPGVPQNIDIADVSAKANSEWKLALSWVEPLDTGAGISYYDIQHSDNNLSYASEATSTDVSYFDLNLVQKYHYYKVRACDSANNCGAYTSPISMFPDGKFTEPAILLNGPTASAVTTKRATLSWTTDRASDSWVKLGLSTGEYMDEEVANSDQTTDHQLNLDNLTPGTEYFYVVRWTDEDGNTGVGEERTFETALPPFIADVRVTNVGINSAIISFTITGAYKANVKYGATTSYGGVETINTSPIETEYSIQLTDLADGIKHHYSLDLEDEEGNVYGFEDHSFTTPPVPKISNIEIEDVKDSTQPTLRVYWETNTATSSIITYSPTAFPDLVQDIVEIEPVNGEHAVDVPGLSPKTLYSLTISGVDSFGNKAVSDLQQFTTATDTRSPRISRLKVIGSILPAEVQPNKAKSAQLIVSWETDEPATSQVEYAEGTSGEYSQKTTANNDLSYHHVVVISNLNPSSVYHLRGISNDSAANIGKSVDFISITPKATNSVLELVFGSLADIFDFLR